jgi:hypothetical protein
MLFISHSYRFPTTFTEMEEASYMKRTSESLINEALNSFHNPMLKGKNERRKLRKREETTFRKEYDKFMKDIQDQY